MEVLLVLAILVILGSLAVTMFTGVQRSANIKAAQSQISLIESALEQAQFALGVYPSDLSSLRSSTPPAEASGANSQWSGPYLNKDVPPDPWGNPYQYNPNGGRNTDKADVWSLGPDGQDGTADDIGNWPVQ